MNTNYILLAFRGDNKEIILQTKSGKTTFNVPKDPDSLRKIKQAISFKQNVKVTLDKTIDGELAYSATKGLPDGGTPFPELMATATDYMEIPPEVPKAQAELMNFVHARMCRA